MLRNNQKIVGFNLGDFRKIFGQYADDIDLYLKDNQESVRQAFNILTTFCSYTGCKINYDKTTIYKTNSAKKALPEFYTQFENAVHFTNIVGVNITRAATQLQHLNDEEMITKIKGILTKWKSRQLSLLGKITVVNTLKASLFVYKMTVLPTIKDKYVEKIDKLIQAFIWDNKKPKISKQKLKCNKRDGGGPT